MKNDRNFWINAIKRGLYAVSILIVSAIYPLINRYTGRERELTTVLDNLIPFNKYFIFAYVLWYIYIAAFLVYFCLFDERKYYKVLMGINIGMIISFIIYLLFPTTVVRPAFAPGSDAASVLLLVIRGNDNPYNCFPSIHVINTLIVAIYVQKDNIYLNKFIKTVSILCAAAIIYSTFAIKQHVVLDAVSASVIAYGMYALMDRKEIAEKVRSIQRVSEI